MFSSGQAGATSVIRQQSVLQIQGRNKCFSTFRASPQDLCRLIKSVLMLEFRGMSVSNQLLWVVQCYAQVKVSCWETYFKLRAGSQLADRASLILSVKDWET